MTDQLTIGAPPPWLTALEYRAVGERAHLSMTRPLLRRLPAGDGHAVLVLPGFGAGDRSTLPLRRVLRDLGYRTYGWNLGVNLGPTDRIIEGLVRRLHHASRLGEPVSIVGWSLGGLYAREMARARPDLVRCVVTLGSPMQMTSDDTSSASPMFDALSRFHREGFDRSLRDVDRPRLTVPNTSIWSKTDGVVRWQACLIEQTEISENIRVVGSHCGLGFNTSAIVATADRLAQPVGAWQPFSAPWYLRGAFPPASDLDRHRLPATA